MKNLVTRKLTNKCRVPGLRVLEISLWHTVLTVLKWTFLLPFSRNVLSSGEWGAGAGKETGLCGKACPRTLQVPVEGSMSGRSPG